jgi:ABC-type uncharacterized transport system substrate-binding protein
MTFGHAVPPWSPLPHLPVCPVLLGFIIYVSNADIMTGSRQSSGSARSLRFASINHEASNPGFGFQMPWKRRFRSQRMNSRLGPILCFVLLSASLSVPASAHPHVWINARAEVMFAPDSKVMGIRHQWTFDEAYTAYVTQGLDKDGDGKLTPEELQELAEENAQGLSEFEYFTTLKVQGKQQTFDAPRDARMSMDGNQVTMTFLLPLKAAVPVNGALAIQIDDPSFFVYFSLSDQSSVTLANAPQGCVTNIAKAKPLDAAMQQILQDEGAIQAAPPGANFSVEYSNKAIIACP